jgi:ATP-binding cassette subfamily B protein RaxB
MTEMADQLGLHSRAVRIELDELNGVLVPCILHWGLDHFVVLKEVLPKNRGIVVHDPARGVRTVSWTETSRQFTGVVLELEKMASFAPKELVQRPRLRDLFGELDGVIRASAQILILAIVLEFFIVIGPFYMQLVIDQVLPSADHGLLVTLAVGFLLLLVFQTFIGVFRSWMVLYLTTNLKIQWSSNVLSHLFRLPLAFFYTRHLGDIVSKFRSVENIQRTLTSAFLEGVLDGLMSVTMLVIMLTYSPLLTLLVVAALVGYGLVRALSLPRYKRVIEEVEVSAANENSFVLESLRAIQTIKLLGHESGRRMRWRGIADETANLQVSAQRITIFLSGVRTIFLGAEGIVIGAVGASMVLDNKITLGMLFAFVSYKMLFSQRATALLERLFEIGALRVQTERLGDILLETPESKGGNSSQSVADETSQSVEVRGLSFRYGAGDPWILKDLSFRVAAGESAAIIGPSGCGKSTLIKLLVGLIEPVDGEILIGGRLLADLGKGQLRQMVAAVMQDDHLLSGSLADNICFFEDDADMDRIIACATTARFHQDVESMPMGYHTLVGDLGSALSGGQKQRVLLARALYRRPKILFLDEATSHVDVMTERGINESISALLMTKIVAAHRPETIESAGQIIDLSATRFRK